ncbi:42654_t:CDS:1, partial [Gigaspora margarita]
FGSGELVPQESESIVFWQISYHSSVDCDCFVIFTGIICD